MYKCEICKKQIEKNIPQMKRITQKRTTDNGWEIVREIKLCPECYGGKYEDMVLRKVQDTLQQQHGAVLPKLRKQPAHDRKQRTYRRNNIGVTAKTLREGTKKPSLGKIQPKRTA